MCVALPMKIVEVVDAQAKTVRIVPDATTASDRAGAEVVSAVLVTDEGEALEDLVGGWGIAHAGFLVSRLDEAEARSRLAIFAAMDGADDPLAALLDDELLGETRSPSPGRD